MNNKNHLNLINKTEKWNNTINNNKTSKRIIKQNHEWQETIKEEV